MGRVLLLCVLLVAAGCGGSDATGDSASSGPPQLLRIAVPGDPFAVAVAPDGAIWTSMHDAGKVVRVDPHTHKVTAVARIAGNGTALAYAHGSMWAVGWKRALYRVADLAGTVAQTIGLPRPDQLAVDGTSLWISNWEHNSVSQVDARTGKPMGTVTAGPVPVPGEQGVAAVAAGSGSVWIVRGDRDTVYRVNPRNGSVQAVIHVGATPTSAAFGQGSLWVANLDGNSVSRIDPATNRVTATIPTQAAPAYAAAAGGAMWVTNFYGDSLTRIDPATNHTRQVKVCFGAAGIAAHGNTLWVACPKSHHLVRVTAS